MRPEVTLCLRLCLCLCLFAITARQIFVLFPTALTRRHTRMPVSVSPANILFSRFARLFVLSGIGLFCCFIACFCCLTFTCLAVVLSSPPAPPCPWSCLCRLPSHAPHVSNHFHPPATSMLHEARSAHLSKYTLVIFAILPRPSFTPPRPARRKSRIIHPLDLRQWPKPDSDFECFFGHIGGSGRIRDCHDAACLPTSNINLDHS